MCPPAGVGAVAGGLWAGFTGRAGFGGDENDCEFECERIDELAFGGLAAARIEPPWLLPTLPSWYRAGCCRMPAAPGGEPSGAGLWPVSWLPDWLRENWLDCASGGLLPLLLALAPFWSRFFLVKMAMMFFVMLGWRRGSRDAVLGETGLGGWEVEVDGEGTLVGSERWGMCDGRAANWNAGGVDWRAESEAVCPCFDGRWAVGGGCDAEGRRRRCAAGVTGAAGASAE